MSDTQQGHRLEELSQEELLRLVKRGKFVRDQQNQRLSALIGENLELLAIIQELQEENRSRSAATNGEVTTPVRAADLTP